MSIFYGACPGDNARLNKKAPSQIWAAPHDVCLLPTVAVKAKSRKRPANSGRPVDVQVPAPGAQGPGLADRRRRRLHRVARNARAVQPARELGQRPSSSRGARGAPTPALSPSASQSRPSLLTPNRTGRRNVPRRAGLHGRGC
ncbi:hypothetical protein BRADI_3g37628v3 [Brachypodium distachyon]|uniref:Uncharacterized protein n=1 Tax=Brachypodium distachyon TaxID=15368 RepID=A0A2K2D1S7_BRADI|nr:hypothetical protein BRADI_3g37628v3 [Brachypodium distachyon]